MVGANAFIAHKVAEASGVALELQRESKFIPAVQIKKAIMGQSSESFLTYFAHYLTQVADYKPAWSRVCTKINRAIFKVNPAAVTAWICLGKRAVN